MAVEKTSVSGPAVLMNIKGELFHTNYLSYKNYHILIFSAECTFGMVRGLTPLKHYGVMALWHFGTMEIRCKL